MFGIIILLVVYTILGAMLAWIAGMVAREEVEVKTGVVTLIIAGIISFLAGLGIDIVLTSQIPNLVVTIAVQLGVLTLCIHVIAKLSWKHSAIIAGIYTGVLVVFGIALASCASN